MPCDRTGCGEYLACCRPDCPFVVVEIEPGLRRIYDRMDFIALVSADIDPLRRKL